MALHVLVLLLLSSALVFFGFINVTGVQRFLYLPHDNPHVPVHTAPSSLSSTAVHAPKQNLWAQLRDDEVAQIIGYLHSQENELNLTKTQSAGAWDNYVLSIESIPPPKSKALPYLDHGAEAPERFARIVVNHGAQDEVEICEYSIGPLPISSDTDIKPLTNGHTKGKHCTRNRLADFAALLRFARAEMAHVADLLDDLLGDALGHGDDLFDKLVLSGRTLKAGENGKAFMWVSIAAKADCWSLLPQGLYMELDVTSRNISAWHILRWFYNGKIYKDTDDFRAAWETPGFVKSLPNRNAAWTDPDDFESQFPGREKVAPVMVQPGGSRVGIDYEENFISWMGFEFYVTSHTANAMALYDIKFRGERVMYELGLQEALAHYAGDNPMQSGQLWLDTFFGMGLMMFELVPGYDCPAYAAFLNTSFSRKEQKWENTNSICIFEYTADYPLQRHTTDNYVTVSKNNYLVVRSVSTVGNYDYTIEYLFYLDGTIVVQVRASGYIISAYLTSPPGPDQGERGENEYGYRVNEAISGSFHDHVINFKADLDIAGEENTLLRVDIEHTDKEYAWDVPGRENPRHTMHLVTTPIETETGLDWPRNWASQYIVVNNASRNAWGEKRGYRIAPRTGQAPHLTIRNSTSLERASQWANHHLWVLKNKDSELRSSHELNFLSPGEPLVDFDDYLDGENVVQEDLVLYFNLGAHHIPHAGDIPNTLEHTSATSVMFMPHNFHDRDPSRSSSHGVKVKLDREKGHSARYFGAHYNDGFTVSKEQVEPDLNKYSGGAHPWAVDAADGQLSQGQESIQLSFNNTLIGMGIIGW